MAKPKNPKPRISSRKFSKEEKRDMELVYVQFRRILHELEIFNRMPIDSDDKIFCLERYFREIKKTGFDEFTKEFNAWKFTEEAKNEIGNETKYMEAFTALVIGLSYELENSRYNILRETEAIISANY